MGKIKAAAGAALLCLLYFFISCAGSGARTCVQRADTMAALWDEAALNLYRYSGQEIEFEGHGGYMLLMTPESSFFASEEALREYQSYGTVRRCVETVYRDLSECFAGEGACVVIAVCGGDGRPLFTFYSFSPRE